LIISTGSFPNGIAVSPDDGTLAIADYAGQPDALLFVLERAECCLHPNVAMTHRTRRLFFATTGSYNPGAAGGPDGIHYDVHGNLWAACGIGGIIEYDPRGFIVGYVPLPAKMQISSRIAVETCITTCTPGRRRQSPASPGFLLCPRYGTRFQQIRA
jgi:sugar lactone lactonase YvrE